MKKRQIDGLTPIQRYVTREKGTESPFRNEYWNHFQAGIYVDVVTGKPLFTSLDKFRSSCGWPSFSKPIDAKAIKEDIDESFGMIRTEVSSSEGGSHLGHVFDDGPKELGGLRYCINSAALRFIPVSELEKEGYGDLLPQFKK